jgi:hypothetical protein
MKSILIFFAVLGISFASDAQSPHKRKRQFFCDSTYISEDKIIHPVRGKVYVSPQLYIIEGKEFKQVEFWILDFKGSEVYYSALGIPANTSATDRVDREYARLMRKYSIKIQRRA